MKAIALMALALASLSAAAQAQESELGGKVRSGQEVSVPAGETVQGDLYASGGTVRIDGRVEGDLVATGGRVSVSGTVTGDVMAAAGTAEVSGQVDGDLRAAVGQAEVRGRVGEDLLVTAGRVTVARNATVGEDLIFAAGQATMDGTVAGDVLGATGDWRRGGSVAGSEQVTVQEPEDRPTLAERALDAVRRYASILVVGVLLLWLAPRTIRGAADSVRQRPLVSFGVGILGIIGVVLLVLAVILVTILVAIALGLLGLSALTGAVAFGGSLATAIIVFLFFLAVAFGAQAAVGLGLGRLVFGADERSFLRGFVALALGLLVVVLVSVIPLVGGWLSALLVLLGLGALVLMVRPRRRRLVEQPA